MAHRARDARLSEWAEFIDVSLPDELEPARDDPADDDEDSRRTCAR